MANNMFKEIIEQNDSGYAYGITVFNELFIGNIRNGIAGRGIDFYKNTEENLKMVREQYELYKDMK